MKATWCQYKDIKNAIYTAETAYKQRKTEKKLKVLTFKMSTDIKLVDIHYNDHSGKVWKTFADPNHCNIDTFVEMVKIDTRSR